MEASSSTSTGMPDCVPKKTTALTSGRQYAALVLGQTSDPNDMAAALAALGRNVGNGSSFPTNHVSKGSVSLTSHEYAACSPRQMAEASPRSPRSGGPLARTAMSSLMSGYDVPQMSSHRSEFGHNTEYQRGYEEASSTEGSQYFRKRDEFTNFVEVRACVEPRRRRVGDSHHNMWPTLRIVCRTGTSAQPSVQTLKVNVDCLKCDAGGGSPSSLPSVANLSAVDCAICFRRFAGQ